MQDITELQQARLAVEHQRHLLRTVLENSPSGLALFDAERNLLLHNPQYARLLSWSAEHLAAPGLRYDGLLHQRWERGDFHEAADWEAFRAQVLRSLESRRRVVLSRRTFDGKTLEAHAIPLPDGGTLMCYIDITELTDARLELERPNRDLRVRTQEAEAANRAKSDFLANMSHEIRTPMNAIIGLTGLALDGELTRRQRGHLDKVQTSAKALLRLLNDILDYSKIEAGRLDIERVPFELAEVVRGVAELFAPMMEEKSIIWRVDLPKELPRHLLGDAFRLGQVLINLVGNAVKFTERGEVAFSAVVVDKTAADLSLRMTVRDTGIGMTAGQIEHLFVEFTQADSSITRKYGGSGLGLSISKRLIGLMGGEITVASAPQQGSAFSFTARFQTIDAAPLHNAGPALAPLRGLAQRAKPISGASVLVVDDDESNRTLA
ncbi:MAG: ATP-binding protein, partial [Candidatus Methylumidiphilus sp.]